MHINSREQHMKYHPRGRVQIRPTLAHILRVLRLCCLEAVSWIKAPSFLLAFAHAQSIGSKPLGSGPFPAVSQNVGRPCKNFFCYS